MKSQPTRPTAGERAVGGLLILLALAGWQRSPWGRLVAFS